MVDYAPKEKNLILRLSLATLMPMLQVKFRLVEIWKAYSLFSYIIIHFFFTVFLFFFNEGELRVDFLAIK